MAKMILKWLLSAAALLGSLIYSALGVLIDALLERA